MSNLLFNFLKTSLAQSMPIMGRVFVTWNSVELECVYNDQFQERDLSSGSWINTGDRATIFIQTCLFPGTQRPKQGEIVTLKSREWRIESISKGEVRWELNLVDKNLRGDT